MPLRRCLGKPVRPVLGDRTAASTKRVDRLSVLELIFRPVIRPSEVVH
jgi:hypothetical protein